ncbi:MAG: hypothetical protein IPJ82_24965 [Lewinellaceae bacterium]|nr:hypothetical protein [Lewinellaceae bacterium]
MNTFLEMVLLERRFRIDASSFQTVFPVLFFDEQKVQPNRCGFVDSVRLRIDGGVQRLKIKSSTTPTIVPVPLTFTHLLIAPFAYPSPGV